MAILTPGWNILAVTGSKSNERPPDYSDLRNALLYADQVVWLPAERISPEMRHSLHLDRGFSPPKSDATDLQYFRFREKLQSASLLGTSLWIAEPSAGKGGVEIKFGWDLLHVVSSCCVVIGCESFPANFIKKWDAHAAAHVLMEALSNLLLPDVAALPVEAIAEMKDRLAPFLNPMRAEMLRLTEQLRKAIHDDATPPLGRGVHRTLTTISLFHPTLAIAAYHHFKDLWQLPRLI